MPNDNQHEWNLYAKNRVRQAETRDLERILTFQRELDLPVWSPSHFEAEWGNPQIARLWVVDTLESPFEFGKIKGYALVHVLGAEAELLTIAVGLKFQRQGLGRCLWRHAWRSMQAEGVQKCFLEVRFSHSGAQTLYQNEGFRALGVRKRYYSDGEDALIMVCEHGK